MDGTQIYQTYKSLKYAERKTMRVTERVVKRCQTMIERDRERETEKEGIITVIKKGKNTQGHIEKRTPTY
jgi:hypothetical protein